MVVSKTSVHIHIKIKMPNPSQEPPASSIAPNEDSKDMDVLCTFKIKIESWNSDHGYIKDLWPYPNQDQDAKPQSGTSGILQSPKWWLKGHGCSLHLQNQNRETKFGTCVYQIPFTMSQLWSRCQTPVKNLQNPPKPKIRTLGAQIVFAHSNIKIKSQNSEHWSTKDQWPYSNQDQDAKPQSGTSSILQRL